MNDQERRSELRRFLEDRRARVSLLASMMSESRFPDADGSAAFAGERRPVSPGSGFLGTQRSKAAMP